MIRRSSLLLLGALWACEGIGDPAVIVVTPSTGTLKVGETLQLAAAVMDADGDTVPNAIVLWSSSAPTVASVSQGGLISAEGGGSASITAQTGLATGGATITVTPVLTGQWSGSSSGLTLSLTLTEDAGGTVSGSGTIAATTSLTLSVQGSHTHPNVLMTMSNPCCDPVIYQGTMQGNNTINGEMNGSGFVNFTLNLTRVGTTTSAARSHSTPVAPIGQAPRRLRDLIRQ